MKDKNLQFLSLLLIFSGIIILVYDLIHNITQGMMLVSGIMFIIIGLAHFFISRQLYK